MELKLGYKQTEVGVIPEEWEVKRLGDLGGVVRGGSPRPAGDPRYFNGDFIPWLTVAALTNISEHQLTVSQTVGGLTEEGSKLSRTLPEGSVIIANSGATLGVAKLLGLTCCANDGIAAIINQRLGDKPFVCYFVNTQTKRLREVIATGNGQPNLNTGLIREIPIPFPPPQEQRAIAEALSDVDGLLGGLDRLIAKKRDLKQAAMQQLLSGQTRLPGFHGEWEVKRLGDVSVRLANGALYQPTNSTGLPVTRIETIADGTIDMSRVGYGARTSELEEYRMLPGDILFSHINSVDHIGKVAIYSGEPPLYHGMNLLLLRVGSSLDRQFLFYWLGSRKGRNKAVSLARQAVNQASINTSDLKRVEIPLPTLPEQTAIAKVLTDMDSELTALEQRREKTRVLKQAMMQELLTGKTRLASFQKATA